MTAPTASELGLPGSVTTAAFNDTTLPLVIVADQRGTPLGDLVGHKAALQGAVTRFGALLFRGFAPPSAAEFEAFVNAIGERALSYTERSSPRKDVEGRVYSSTEHPPHRKLVLHNEQSYNLSFPLRIFFLCQVPSAIGGETPIADVGRVFARIKPAFRDAFIERGYLIQRNYTQGLGMRWTEAFQTEDPKEAEAYFEKNDIGFEWLEGGGLRTRQRRRVAAIHPRANKPVWFNHLAAFHATALDRMEPGLRKSLERLLGPDGMPYNTFYGDGVPIEPEVIEDIHEAYAREQVQFRWEEGDLLMVDNMQVAHSRTAFEPPRRVLVAMADLFSWSAALPPPIGT